MQRRTKKEKILDISKARKAPPKEEEEEDENSEVLKQKAHIALKWHAMEHETIKYVRFLDDERPQYIFVILQSSKTNL